MADLLSLKEMSIEISGIGGCLTLLNLTKKYLSFLAEGSHTIVVPDDQVLRGHNFSPLGNANFIAKGSVKQHQEDVKDLNHKHKPPQLKERFSSVNELFCAFHTTRPRADRHHDLIEGTPQRGEDVRTQRYST